MNEDLATLLLAIAIALLVLILGVRALRRMVTGGAPFWRRVTVFAWQIGLLYRDGRYLRQLAPGAHWLSYRDAIVAMPANEHETSVTAQEILTADRLQVKLSAIVVTKVVDPQRAFESGADRPPTLMMFTYPAMAALDREIKLVLRTVATQRTLSELIENRLSLDEELSAALAPTAARLGLELVQAAVRDVILPAEMRRAYSEAERARLESLAALERARGEQASLRSLANAARMLRNSPELMNLRVLQTVDGLDPKKNVTVVLGEGVMAKVGGAGAAAPEQTSDRD